MFNRITNLRSETIYNYYTTRTLNSINKLNTFYFICAGVMESSIGIIDIIWSSLFLKQFLFKSCC